MIKKAFEIRFNPGYPEIAMTGLWYRMLMAHISDVVTKGWLMGAICLRTAFQRKSGWRDQIVFIQISSG
ncbi:MAG: hypothetical protein WD097_09380 [Balneolales bacterium]